MCLVNDYIYRPCNIEIFPVLDLMNHKIQLFHQIFLLFGSNFQSLYKRNGILTISCLNQDKSTIQMINHSNL